MGAQLAGFSDSPDKKKEDHKGENAKIRFCCSEMQGWRGNMEDSHIADLDIGDGNSLFAVFDGHGGPEVAKFVKNHFTKNLINSAAYKRKDYKLALENTFLKMDRLLQTEKGKQELKLYMEEESREGNMGYQDYMRQVESQAGCTATVALITNLEIYCANAGDSRTVVCERGNAVELSKDHKPDLPEERSRIMKAGGEVSEGRVNGMLALSRAIGDFDYKPISPPKDAQPSWFLNNHMVTAFPDVVVKQLHKDIEFLVLACDGIWDCKTSDQVIQYFKQMLPQHGTSIKEIQNINHKLLDEICPATFEEMRQKDGIGSDNMTIMIIDFLQNSGGCNSKVGNTQMVQNNNKNTNGTKMGGSGGGQVPDKAAGLSSKQVNGKNVRRF